MPGPVTEKNTKGYLKVAKNIFENVDFCFSQKANLFYYIFYYTQTHITND